MATPQYGQQKIQAAPIPGARLTAVPTADTFGAGMGDKLAKAGAELYEAEIYKADEQAVYEARRSLNDWELTNVYDPKVGAITKRGRDAFDLPERLTESYDKHVGDVTKGLSTDRQRFAFQRLSEARRQQVMEWTQKHVAVEREKFHVDQFNADVESSAERAARNPALAAGEIAVIRQRTIGFFKERGASDEVVQSELQKRETNAHAKIVQALMSGGAVTDAQKWLDANGTRMDKDVVTQLEGRLKPQADAAKGIIIADAVEKKLGPGATYEQANALITEQSADNPVARKIAVAEWEHRRAVREREANAINKRNDQAVDSWMAKVYASGRAPSIAVLQTLPEFKAMDGTQQLQAVDKARNIMRGLRSEGERDVKTDLTTFSRVLENLTELNPGDIIAERGLSRGDKEQLIRQRHALMQGQGKFSIPQLTTIFNTSFLGAVDKKKISDLPQPEKERLGNMLSTVTSRVEEYAASLPKGRKVSGDEIQKIVDDALIRGEDPTRGVTIPLLGTFGRPQVFKGEALPGASFAPKKAEKVTEIPYGIRREISRGLADAGRPANDAAIIETYNSAVDRPPARGASARY